MFVSNVNDVKIYNLSAGKSLPSFLTEHKRKRLENSHVDLRKRIELIQDFDMPDECGTISMSPDNQYIIGTGKYKPRVKCFEVNNLSIKFERCFDSEVTATEILSDDYSKMVFLMSDRYVEFHAAHGRHYRLRIPRCGYDMKYHQPTCDLFLVGASSDIYRLNLEMGKFLQPYQTATKQGINACDINPEHHLLCVGTQEGTVEAWDPRDRKRCATLDAALNIPGVNGLSAVTSIKFKNSLVMGVGTETGHVLLYDIRSNVPIVVKDHYNQLPITKIAFNPNENVVYSLDDAIFKIWNETNGQQVAYIESESKFNDFCTVPNTGMFFFAQQTSKMLSYYIPSLGPAPRWCSFLDNLTEEIESETVEDIYDNYKFVTRPELNALGLNHLEGTNLLRASMHGFFIDVRLYNKAKEIIEPFSFEKYRKEKIRKQIEAERPERIKIKSNLPSVNQELALKLMEAEERKKKKGASNLLKDDRFKELFENPDFEVDKNAMEYKMLTPVISRLDKSKIKELKRKAQDEALALGDDDEDEGKSTDDDLFSERDGSSDDEDEQVWSKEMKKQYKEIRKEQQAMRDEDSENEDESAKQQQPVEEPSKVIRMKEYAVKTINKKSYKTSLGDRIRKDDDQPIISIGSHGNRQMSFQTGKISKDVRQREMQMRKHREERKRVIRPTTSLKLKKYVQT